MGFDLPYCICAGPLSPLTSRFGFDLLPEAASAALSRIPESIRADYVSLAGESVALFVDLRDAFGNPTLSNVTVDVVMGITVVDSVGPSRLPNGNDSQPVTPSCGPILSSRTVNQAGIYNFSVSVLDVFLPFSSTMSTSWRNGTTSLQNTSEPLWVLFEILPSSLSEENSRVLFEFESLVLVNESLSISFSLTDNFTNNLIEDYEVIMSIFGPYENETAASLWRHNVSSFADISPVVDDGESSVAMKFFASGYYVFIVNAVHRHSGTNTTIDIVLDGSSSSFVSLFVKAGKDEFVSSSFLSLMLIDMIQVRYQLNNRAILLGFFLAGKEQHR